MTQRKTFYLETINYYMEGHGLSMVGPPRPTCAGGARCNTFSNDNRMGNPAVTERLFWQMHARLAALAPRFLHPKHKGRLVQFRMRRLSWWS